MAACASMEWQGMINRPTYITQLRQYKDQPLIKILTGVRRSGKSTLFHLFMEELRGDGVSDEQIQSLNLEDMDNAHLLDIRRLHRHIAERLVPDRQNYVFLDEIQNVPDFQKAVRSLSDKGNVDLYLTGSNSKLQSGEWATSIAGRYVEIHVLPLSFSEYMSAQPAGTSRDEAYDTYTRIGSFPQVSMFPEPLRHQQARHYLRDLYNSIVLKDVMDARRIRETDRLDRLARFMGDSIGCELSVKKISDTMKSDGVQITPPTVEAYVQALRDCYLFYKAARYDVKGKRLLKTQGKHYIVDPGMRQLLAGAATRDTGRLLENIVFLELLRRGYNVGIGKVDIWGADKGGHVSVEVDFVAERWDERLYIQVCESMYDPATRERELRPLQAINDAHPKIILSRDYSSQQYDGVQHVNVLKWLLGEAP